MRKCPVCGRTYGEYSAISRVDDYTEICPSCGVMEALSIFCKASFNQRDVYTAYSQESDDSATTRYYGCSTAEFE